MKVKEVMSKNPLSVPSTTPIKEVADLFKQYPFWTIFIVDSNNLVGVVTRNDIKNRSRGHKLSDPISSIMSKKVFQIDQEEDVEKAIHQMDFHHSSSLAVVDKGRLCGVVTRHDIQNRGITNNVCDYCKTTFSSGMEFFVCAYCKKHLCMYHSRPELHYCPGVDWQAIKKEKYDRTEKKFENFKRNLEMRYWAKQLAKLILLILIVLVIIYAFGYNPFQKKCSDGTISSLCSTNKPYLCENGNFVYDAIRCGCPGNQIIDNGTCRELRDCADGTLNNNCSVSKPLFCYDGNLSPNPSICGCPAGTENVGGICFAVCSDQTLEGQCSTTKPLYCKNGTLVNDSQECGCPPKEVPANGGKSCMSLFETNPKYIEYSYTLKGNSSTIGFIVYGGLNEYLANKSRFFDCNPTCPTEPQMVISPINDPDEKKYLDEMVSQIQYATSYPDDQARIAISLVQTMPFDWASFNSNSSLDRYPYQVLYDDTGICGEKAPLLAYLLRGLGYGTVLFDFTSQNHMAVGIKCPAQYSYLNSGYCFVESTTPSIITDSSESYVGAGKLDTTPLIIPVSNGKSFDTVSEEYNDSQTWQVIEASANETGGVVDPGTYAVWLSLVKKYGINVSSNQN